MPDLNAAISRFGAAAKAKLTNPSATGEPEDQLRAPLEQLFHDLAELCGFKRDSLAAVGESSLSTLKTRPDYAITLRNVLVGFVEVKAPGKGSDPRRYKGHDKEQWEKLQSLPNLLYTDGNSFSNVAPACRVRIVSANRSRTSCREGAVLVSRPIAQCVQFALANAFEFLLATCPRLLP